MVENYGNTYELLRLTVGKMFNQGARYSRKEIKEKLQALYNANGIDRKAKHTDLGEIFKQVKDVTVKGERFVEIVKK